MGRSLGLAAYRALSWRKSTSDPGPQPGRPAGELVWMHATGSDRLAALADLAVRLKALRSGLQILITVGPDTGTLTSPPGCDLILRLGDDHPAAVGLFLDHWHPQLGIWTGGGLMPNLITAASGRGIPMILLDMAGDEVPTTRRRWLPDLARATLGCFDAITPRDETAAALIRRCGIAEDRLTPPSPLRTGARPPPCRNSDLDGLAQELGGRPVWLAAGLPAAEFDTVLAAHRGALRLVHRLLLLVSLADPADRDLLRQRLGDADLRTGDWDEGDHIGEETQVLVSADADDLGLWYRLAPLCLVAGTFRPDASPRSPLEAAALGSAVLHGPETGRFSQAFAHLDAAGAARRVPDTERLSKAVIELVAPDRSAHMALAGWEVVTEGAELIDRVTDLVQDMLDLQESTGAGA